MNKLHIALIVWGLLIITGQHLLQARDYQYDTSTGWAFIDDSFPQTKADYEQAVASGEYIRLVDYSSTGAITVRKEINKQVDKKPTKISQENAHRYTKNDYVWMNINWHIMDKKQIFWRSRIQYWCDQYKIDCKTPLAIAFAESRYRPEAKHGCKWYSKKQEKVCSTAGGLFQFVDATRKSSSKKYLGAVTQKFDWEKNIQVALQKIKNEWTWAWNASKSKWKK